MYVDTSLGRALIVNAEHGVGPEVADALSSAGAEVFRATPNIDPEAPIGEALATFLDAVVPGGVPDILVLSAPPVANKPVLAMTEAELRAVTAAELVLPALLMQEAARRMVEQEHGRIICFASMSAKTGVHHNTATFAAAKGGLLAFMRGLAAETAPHGVTVNGIATALFEPQAANMSVEKRTRLEGEIPVGRFGRSIEAAHAVLFLVSGNAGYVTGETLNMSGGRFMD